MIPYGKQDIRPEDIDAVVEVLKSDYLTQGPSVPAFEQALCHYSGSKHAVAVNSATSALHIACLALGLREGDYLWTTPISFVASSNCALYCGAKVDFVDIDPLTFNLCPIALEQKLKTAEHQGKLPKVVVPVHLGGLPCDMRAINALAVKYGFSVIEDASHAIGGSYCGAKVGGCQYSDITVFSFHPVKTLACGEGGMALTNSEELYQRMQSLRCHGITRDLEAMTEKAHGPWYYQQVNLGYNYRLSDIHAALGLSQLSRLDSYIDKRKTAMDRYKELLSDSPICFQASVEGADSGLHLCLIQLPDPERRSRVFHYMREKEIGVNVHYIPIHWQPYYRSMGFGEGDYPFAEAYYAKAMTLPLHVGLTPENIDYIVTILKDAIA